MPVHARLYKPENFNYKKRYPVIFHYYEKMSDDLNKYHKPESAADFIDIPWFVSRGYIVVTPDIEYKIGEPGKSAYNSVMGAVNYLSKFSWFDKDRMGLQGHSFGGFETNYIITHTNVFAGAVSSSGVCNNISWYNSVDMGWLEVSMQFNSEIAMGRMGTDLWTNPERFIENSPILRANKNYHTSFIGVQ